MKKRYTLKGGDTENTKIKKKNKTIKIKRENEEKKSPVKIMKKDRYNEDFSGLMDKLNKIMMKKGEPFRGRAYTKAEETILSIDEDIKDYSELKGKPGIGETILSKLKEYQETGTLKMLEKYENDPIQIFTEIHGIGPKKAEALKEKGIKTIEELKNNKDELNDTQKMGLQYYEELQERIPREEIVKYESEFKKVFESVNDGKGSFEIVGSYRRGAKTSGDIDMIITHSENKTDIFKNFLNELKSKNIILEFLTNGKVKSLTITRLPDGKARRVDFLYSSPEEYPFAILYFTGSKAFNTVMRQHALKQNLTLNEHGFHKMVNKKKGDKIKEEFKSEEDIFKYLGLVYKTPTERKDGRAIVVDKNASKEKEEPKEEKKEEPKEEKKKEPKEEVKEELNEKKKRGRPKKNTALAEFTKVKSIKNKTPPKNKTLKIVEKFDNPMVKKMQLDGEKYLDTLSEKQLNDLLQKSSDEYYNSKVSIMTDNEYDILKEYIEKKYPKNKVVDEIGAPVKRDKVKLPYFMGSMDKIKPDTNAIDKWKSKYKGQYVLSCKLDGVSGMYVCDEKSKPKLYTRGNGSVGQDISHIIKSLRLPELKENFVCRGEFIIKKKTFEEKYGKDFANPRNFVSGVINKKSVDKDKLSNIDFVLYEVIEPKVKPSEQMKMLKEKGFDVVKYQEMSDISNDKLSDILVDWRGSYEYEMDGIICADDSVHKRKDGNPDHAFAFKMILSEQIAEAKVLDVIWNPSKDYLLKPRIRIEPIQLGGVKIEYATAFNAEFVEKNKLGVGAIVKIIRSGDVIPYIMDVIQPASITKMPSEEYEWNESHVDILLKNKEGNEIVLNKNITGFFTILGVKNISSGNVQKLMNAGFKSISAILKMKKEDFKNIDGFGEKSADKILTSIDEKIKNASISKIMSASNIFGHGMAGKKLDKIMNAYPDALTEELPRDEKVKKIEKIEGMGTKTAILFVDNIDKFKDFLKETNLEGKMKEVKEVEKKEYDTSHPLYGKNIVMTGFRNEKLSKALEGYGAKMSSSVNSKTFVVLVKDLDETTGKAEEAIKRNIEIMTPEMIIEKYNLILEE